MTEEGPRKKVGNRDLLHVWCGGGKRREKRWALPRCAQATSQMLGQHCASSAEQQPSVRLTDGHTMAWAVPIPYQCTSTNLALQRIWPWRSANQERRIIPP